ncbi:MAG: hypothetical protein SGBAC_003877 [Bacillariaceae sp.]
MNINTIIERNNQTITCLNANDYLAAIDSSSMLLRSLLQGSEIMNLSESDDGELRLDDERYESGGVDHLDQHMLVSAVNECRSSVHDTNSAFIYDHGIPISPSVAVDAATLSAIAIFNAALAYHLAAESGESLTPSESLQKAQRLYHLGYQADAMSQSRLFQFAVINNLAVVERRLGNTALSYGYYDYLSSMLEPWED